MKWYLKGIRNYNNFTGRATRKEYWSFVIINIIIFFLLGYIDRLLGTYRYSSATNSHISLIASFYLLIMALPNIAITIRRLHDVNKSVYWLLILLVPLIGHIVFLYFLLKPSYKGVNDYGKDKNGLLNQDV